MKILRLLFLFSLGSIWCFPAYSGDAVQAKIDLMPDQIRALVAAIDKFESLPYLTLEQKKLANYKIRIRSFDKKVIVDFIAIPRPGDENAIGGNFQYARSIGVVVNSLTGTIEEVNESK